MSSLLLFGDPPMDLFKLEAVSLNSQNLNEKWVQQQLKEEPSLLGLGDLVLKDMERIQAGAGRLDLLLQDPETLKRYEVEIQLGATDASHIIRTVEYWDIERKRYPQYEHAAVIVAEDITSRFLNVIQLFNGAIPLIALKMTAYKVGEQYALTFVKVLDEQTYGLVDEDELEVTDRPYWESKASKESLLTTDHLLKLVNKVESKAVLRYKRHFIGLEVDGLPRNFVSFIPRRTKSRVIMQIKLPDGADTKAKLDEAGIDPLSYDSQFGKYRIGVDPAMIEKQQQVLIGLIQKAADNYGKA